MSKQKNHNISIEQLESDLEEYSSTLQRISNNYSSKKEPSSEISKKTEINYLTFSANSSSNVRIKNALIGSGISNVEDLLDAYNTGKLPSVRNLGKKSLSLLIPFIKSNLLSLEPESITDLYYEMFQNATSMNNDLKTINDIYSSLRQYIFAFELDSEQNLSQNLQYRSLLCSIKSLFPGCKLAISYIRDDFSLLKKSYEKVLRRATNGEFIELQTIGSTLMNASEQDSSTVLKKQFEDYRTTINSIRDKYSSSIALDTQISNLKFSSIPRRNRSIISGLKYGYTPGNSDLDDDYYNYGYKGPYKIETVYELLLFYISSNNPFRVLSRKYLTDDSINIIEKFIQDYLLQLVFTEDIMNAYYTKSKEENGLLQDTKTINDLLQTLQEFQKTVENESTSEQSYPHQNLFNKSPSYYLADPKLREKLNRKALYKSYVRDLISDCLKIRDTLEKIQNCLDAAIQRRRNEKIIKYISELNPSISIRTPGGDCL